MSSCFSPNTEQKYLLNVAGVFASSLVLKRPQPLQDLLSCQNFFWPHDAATISSSTAGPSCQEAPFITFPLIDVLLVAPSPLHHDYGFLPFPFITQQKDGLWPNHLPDQGHPVEFNPKRVCRDHSHYPAPIVGCRGRAPRWCFTPQCPGVLLRPPQAMTCAGTRHCDIKLWLGSRAELP